MMRAFHPLKLSMKTAIHQESDVHHRPETCLICVDCLSCERICDSLTHSVGSCERLFARRILNVLDPQPLHLRGIAGASGTHRAHLSNVYRVSYGWPNKLTVQQVPQDTAVPIGFAS